MNQETAITLRVEPSFDDHLEVFVEIQAAGGEGRLTVIREGFRDPRKVKCRLSGKDADHIRRLLDGLCISGVSPAMMGLDGTTYSLRVNSYPVMLELAWWVSPPTSWVGVTALVDALRALAGECTDITDR
ncbi:MAG TPA: hypothetical protein PLV42_05510 [bacterium]|nr:hypothetical protein [bacterium]